MARIILNYRLDKDKFGKPMICYSQSYEDSLKKLGHKVVSIGGGHERTIQDFSDIELSIYDLLIDLDAGRDVQGKFNFIYNYGDTFRYPIKTAVRFIDTHGNPSLHKRLAPCYNHVFFAVYNRRDLFVNHPSAHWCPNASCDVFDYTNYLDLYDHPNKLIGFFGSKDGLDRADSVVNISAKYGYDYDIREIGRYNRQRWPFTAEAMVKCNILFNRGQKHDGPNQRVIESMLMGRPLITDRDKEDGMSQLFVEGEHYLSYCDEAEVANHIEWCITEPDMAKSMAMRAYKVAKEKHLIKHRVQQILEVCL